jgi:hypothetical protein
MQAKVHQKALLAAGLVDGPADPRLPTLRGLMRAGCHPDALKAFLLEQVCHDLRQGYALGVWARVWARVWVRGLSQGLCQKLGQGFEPGF